MTEATELMCIERVAQMVMNLSTMQETWVQSLGWEDSLEKENGYPLQCSCLESPSENLFPSHPQCFGWIHAQL